MEGKCNMETPLASLLRTACRRPERSHMLPQCSRRKAWSRMAAAGILKGEQMCVCFEGQLAGYAINYNGMLEKNEPEDFRDK